MLQPLALLLLVACTVRGANGRQMYTPFHRYKAAIIAETDARGDWHLWETRPSGRHPCSIENPDALGDPVPGRVVHARATIVIGPRCSVRVVEVASESCRLVELEQPAQTGPQPFTGGVAVGGTYQAELVPMGWQMDSEWPLLPVVEPTDTTGLGDWKWVPRCLLHSMDDVVLQGAEALDPARGATRAVFRVDAIRMKHTIPPTGSHTVQATLLDDGHPPATNPDRAG